jgi:glycosyltransferase involved in cell wall biosynthesis
MTLRPAPPPAQIGTSDAADRPMGGVETTPHRVDRIELLYLIDSLARGGAERSLASMAPFLVEGGVALTVACIHRRDDLSDEIRRAGGRVVYLPPSGRVRRIGHVRDLARTVRPDIVHTTLFEADVAGRLAAARLRVPNVTSLVNTPYGPEHLDDPSLRKWKVRSAQAVDSATGRFVTRFHAVSDHVRDVMAGRLHLDLRRIDVIPRGRDPARLGRRTPARRAASRAALGMSAQDHVVVAVARQEHQKGLDVLLRAVAQLATSHPRLKVVVAGREGTATPVLTRLIEQLGLSASVALLGERDDIPELLCAADTFVLPSRWEGMPGALLEAMAMEVPIVASDLPQVREVADESLARLVPPGDPAALASAICSTLRPASELERQLRSARNRFTSRFTTQVVAQDMLDFYRRSLSQAGSRRS